MSTQPIVRNPILHPPAPDQPPSSSTTISSTSSSTNLDTPLAPPASLPPLPPPTLANLPTDLILSILSALPGPALVRSTQLCHPFRSLIASAHPLWRKLAASDFGIEPPSPNERQTSSASSGRCADTVDWRAVYTHVARRARLAGLARGAASCPYDESDPRAHAGALPPDSVPLQLYACEDTGDYFHVYPPASALAGEGRLANCWCTTPGNATDVSLVAQLDGGPALVTAVGIVNPAEGFDNQVRDVLAFGSVSPPPPGAATPSEATRASSSRRPTSLSAALSLTA